MGLNWPVAVAQTPRSERIDAGQLAAPDLGLRFEAEADSFELKGQEASERQTKTASSHFKWTLLTAEPTKVMQQSSDAQIICILFPFIPPTVAAIVVRPLVASAAGNIQQPPPGPLETLLQLLSMRISSTSSSSAS